MPLSDPDPERVALERRGGGEEPSGSSPRKKKSKSGRRSPGPWSAERRARYESSKSGGSEEPAKPRTPEEVEQGAQICGVLAGTLWSFVAPFAKRRDLTREEADRLGAALDPVLYKYLPSMAEWQLEANLILVVAGLWQATAKKKEVSPEGEAVEVPTEETAPDGRTWSGPDRAQGLMDAIERGA